MSKAPTLWLLLGWLETGTCLLYGGPNDLEMNTKIYSNHLNLDISFDLSLLVIFIQLCRPNHHSIGQPCDLMVALV
jgi:hypothetical protein